MENEDEGMGGSGYRDEGRRGGGRHGGGGGMNPNYFLPKPVKVGDELEITVEAIAAKGDGIAKKDNFVIFIKGAKEGDKLKIRITDVKAKFATGEIIN
jgi:predicted RNA-binding protein with TRAM domain